jgi:cell division septation protein DedD
MAFFSFAILFLSYQTIRNYSTDPEPAKKKYYRVQIGAYTVKANAEAQLAKAKKAGFTDAFIKYD